MKAFFLFFFQIALLLSAKLIFCQNNSDYWLMDSTEAKVIIDESLKDTTLHNAMRYYYLIDSLNLINDEGQAIAFAELILFNLFGKELIESEKPYGICEYNNYWIVVGTMAGGKRAKGGVFLIIFSAKDCCVVRITHEK